MDRPRVLYVMGSLVANDLGEEIVTILGRLSRAQFDPRVVTLGGREVSAQTLNQGHDLYSKHCVSCHGVEGAGDGYVLIVELHDVVYGEVRERGRFRLPSFDDEDFRMSVHRPHGILILRLVKLPEAMALAQQRIT